MTLSVSTWTGWMGWRQTVDGAAGVLRARSAIGHQQPSEDRWVDFCPLTLTQVSVRLPSPLSSNR